MQAQRAQTSEHGALRKILISGMKQSNRSRKPKLNEMTPFNKMMNHNADVKAIAHCSSGDKNLSSKLCKHHLCFCS